MKELENIKPDKPEMAVVVPVQKKKVDKKLFPMLGHRIFELDLKTSVITEIIPENVKAIAVPDIDIRTGKVVGTKFAKGAEIKRRDGCYYCTALNAKNADKVFHQMRGIPYKKPKKQI